MAFYQTVTCVNKHVYNIPTTLLHFYITLKIFFNNIKNPLTLNFSIISEIFTYLTFYKSNSYFKLKCLVYYRNSMH